MTYLDSAKDIKESLTEHFSYVVTVCDASRERFPLWPFTCNILHWSVLDPQQAQGTTERKRQVFRHVRDEISLRVRDFLDACERRQKTEHGSVVLDDDEFTVFNPLQQP